jgi:hypothetical protein
MSIWVPLMFSQIPPEAASCRLTMNLAPAVPRKVIVSVEAFSFIMYG